MTVENDPSQPGKGVQMGRYTLIRRLARGGMGEVFLAMTSGPTGAGFRKFVVVKVLSDVGDASHRQMFLEEARLAALLDHPNVVQTLEVGIEQENIYLTMELLRGQPLDKVVRRLREHNLFTMEAFCVMLSQALAGLHYTHELKALDGSPLELVHRDVSPQNVIVTYDGVVKIVDFGIAKARNSITNTEAGVLKGKATYMSPQQARGQQVDRRADLFAAGVLLWEALAGRRMWERELEVNILLNVATGAIPKLPTNLPEEVTPLVAICEKALKVNPDERFQTAEEFMEALNAFIDSRPITSHRSWPKDVRKVFAKEAEALDAAVAVASRESVPPPPPKDGLLRESTVTGIAGNPSDAVPEEGTATAAISSSPKRGKLVAVGAALAGVVGLLALVGLRVGSPPSVTSEPTPVGSSAVGTANLASAVPSSGTLVAKDIPTATPLASQPVSITVDVSPSSAVLEVNGKSVTERPYVYTGPSDGSVLQLRATAKGLPEVRRRVVVDQTQSVRLELFSAVRGRAAVEPQAQAPTDHTSRPTKPTPTAEPTLPIATTTSTVEPKSPKPKLEIDSRTPY